MRKSFALAWRNSINYHEVVSFAENQMKIRRLFFYLLVVLVTTNLMTVLFCNHIIQTNAEGRLYDNVSQIPYRSVGVLLGTTPTSRYGRVENLFFRNRINAAIALYEAGKIDTLLISGSSKSLDGIDETAAMRDTLAKYGIPKERMILDGKGFRTINSMENVIKVFGIRKFTVISQPFHNERAIYQAEHLNMGDVDVIGFNAADVYSSTAFITYVREYLVRVKVFIDLYL